MFLGKKPDRSRVHVSSDQHGALVDMLLDLIKLVRANMNAAPVW